MRLKLKGDTLRQLCMCPEPHLGLNLAVNLQNFVPNPSSVSFFVGEIKTQTLKKGLVGVSNPSLK